MFGWLGLHAAAGSSGGFPSQASSINLLPQTSPLFWEDLSGEPGCRGEFDPLSCRGTGAAQLWVAPRAPASFSLQKPTVVNWDEERTSVFHQGLASESLGSLLQAEILQKSLFTRGFLLKAPGN